MHGCYQASCSGFSGLATRHVKSPDCHGHPGIRFHGAWNLLELWTTSRSSSQQSCHPRPTCLFAPGNPAAGILPLSGCPAAGGTEWRPRLPLACFCIGIVAQPRIPIFSILAANWHLLPFRSILIAFAFFFHWFASLVCRWPAMSPKIASNKSTETRLYDARAVGISAREYYGKSNRSVVIWPTVRILQEYQKQISHMQLEPDSK